MLDTAGKPITSSRIERSLKYSLIGGTFGAVWFILCQPQQILTVFVRNYLNATDIQLGNFVALLNLAGFFHLGAIILYSFTKRIKTAWICYGLLSRSSAFFISAAAFYVYKGGNTTLALWVVMASSFIFSFMIGNMAGSGWWTWIASLTPENERAAYFGRRSSIAQMMNIVFFYSATWLLDYFNQQVFLVYTLIYLAAGILGELDILMHLFVPEPENAHEKEPFNYSKLLTPLKDRNFLKFALITGFSVLSINIIVPFQAPYITDKNSIGAPNIWLGIMYIISQLAWVLVVPFWGFVMDRMGKKPVVLLGLLYPVSFILYLFLDSSNYWLLLPFISLWNGMFAPAFWEGINQMMLVLAPDGKKTPYIAWFWALMGLVGSLGPLLGGIIMEKSGSIEVTTITALIFLGLSFIIFTTVKTARESSFENVINMITAPSTYRTFYQLPILSSTKKPERVHKALKEVKKITGQLAFDEVSNRMDDPDQTVREEAVLAMGRIGTESAREVLIQQLNSLDSLVRPEAAKALGMMGDCTAIPPLVDALYNGDEELQEESARALGTIYSEDSVKVLKQLIKEDRSERVKVTGAQSIVAHGRLDAVEEVIDLWEQTSNRVLQKQLSISLGNLIGKPGEFYRCITGTSVKREKAINDLFQDVRNGLKKLEILDSGFINHILCESMPALEESYEKKDYSECFTYIYTIILNLISRKLELTETEYTDSSVPEYLKEQDSFLYLGFYLVQRFEQNKGNSGLPFTSTEILLSLYYLKYYCKRESGEIRSARKRQRLSH